MDPIRVCNDALTLALTPPIYLLCVASRPPSSKATVAVAAVATTKEMYEDRMPTELTSPAACRQSKLANILFARELARRHPSITSVVVHPGVVGTGLVTNQGLVNRALVYLPSKIMGAAVLTPEQGCWNQVWAAAAAKKADLVNGAFYMPVGTLADDLLDGCARDDKLAAELWRWTEEVLDGIH